MGANAGAAVLTDAVVVRLVDFGEADRIATLLTRAAGKVSALARGARRSARRFGGALALFGHGEATLQRGRGELWTLTAFSSARGFPGIASDLARVAQSAYVCELARELMPPEVADERLYVLVVDMLARLDAGAAAPAALRRYELAVLDAVGFAPALDRCVGCGAPAVDEDGQILDPRRGGVVCHACGGGHGRPLGARVRRALCAAQAGATDETAALDATDAASARDHLQAILGEHLARPLRSVEFIAKLSERG